MTTVLLKKCYLIHSNTANTLLAGEISRTSAPGAERREALGDSRHPCPSSRSTTCKVHLGVDTLRCQTWQAGKSSKNGTFYGNKRKTWGKTWGKSFINGGFTGKIIDLNERCPIAIFDCQRVEDRIFNHIPILVRIK